MRVSHLAPRCLQWARDSGVGRGPITVTASRQVTGHSLHDFVSLSREVTKITLFETKRMIASQGIVRLRRSYHSPSFLSRNIKADSQYSFPSLMQVPPWVGIPVNLLNVPGGQETLHRPSPRACELGRMLGPVVEIPAWPMFHNRHNRLLEDFVAAQLVGDRGP